MGEFGVLLMNFLSGYDYNGFIMIYNAMLLNLSSVLN